ncbi:MAG: hypothetical protein ACTSP4_00090 [Candidatus Hodarchaeales archaeon]
MLSTNDIAEKLFIERFFARNKTSKLKKIHEELILTLLEDNVPRSRPEIVDILQIPSTTVYDTLQRLIFKNKVRTFKKKTHSDQVGRSRTIYIISNRNIQDIVICNCGFKMIEYDNEYFCPKCRNIVKR